MAGRALIHARVHTMQEPDHVAEAIAWDGDTIIAVGSDEDILSVAHAEGWPVDDLGGRVVIPGFIDSHVHFLHVGVKRNRPDLRGATSRREAFQRVAAWLEEHPGDGAVTAEGWDEAEWDGGPPTRDDLDRIAGGRPLVLRRICGHVAVANSAALPAIRRRWDDERVDADTGTLLEEPSLYLNEVLPADAETLDAAVDTACRVAHALGVTAVGDYEQAPFRLALLRAAAQERLTLRVQCSIYVQQLDDAITEGFRTGRPVRLARRGEDAEAGMETATAELEGAGIKRRMGGLGVVASAKGAIRPGAPGMDDGGGAGPPVADRADAHAGGGQLSADGHTVRDNRADAHAGAQAAAPVTTDPASMLRDGGLKVFLDGSLGGHTALMLEPYNDRPDTRGRAIWSDGEVRDIFQRAHAHGIQIHAHAIGDGAIEQGLAAYGALAEDGTPGVTPYPLGDGAPSTVAHRFEHYEIAHNDQVHRTARLGVWVSSQPNFVGEWSARGGMYEDRIGPRFDLNNRFRTFLGAGLNLCFGSDGMPFGPLYGIQSAVTHPMHAERLSAARAVYHYTAAGAAAMGREDIGVLEVGRMADVLVLDIDDLETRPPRDWTIQETIVGGRTVHRGRRPCISDDDVL